MGESTISNAGSSGLATFSVARHWRFMITCLKAAELPNLLSKVSLPRYLYRIARKNSDRSGRNDGRRRPDDVLPYTLPPQLSV